MFEDCFIENVNIIRFFYRNFFSYIQNLVKGKRNWRIFLLTKFCFFSEDTVYAPAEYIETKPGNFLLRIDGHIFWKHGKYSMNPNHSMKWRCSMYRKFKCKAKATTEYDKKGACLTQKEHTHTKEVYNQRYIRCSASSLVLQLPQQSELSSVSDNNILDAVIPIEEIKTEHYSF